MNARKWLTMSASVALALGGLQAQAAKTLIYCSEGSPEGFDAAQFTAGTTFDASAETIYNRLVQFERGGTKVIPGLATSWDVSPDGLVYTFHLRKGVKFHSNESFKPSRDFNADDVIFTFERMTNKDHPFNKAYPVQFEYASDMGMQDNLTKIEKVDPLTVRMTLKTVDASFIANLAMSFASVYSAEYADKLLKDGKASEINTQPIGTGPFQLVRYDKDAQIRYKAFAQYWGGKQPIDNLIFAITKDSAVRAQKLKAGECQISSYPKPAEVATLKDDPKLKVMQQNGLNIGYLSFNVKHKPFDNADVRRALSMAINKKAIIDAVYQGAGQAAVNPIPPTMWSYNKSVKDYEYNPTKAKELLAKAGYPNGFETKLWALPVQRPYNPGGKQMAEMVQADLAKIGVKAEITTYEWGEYLKRGKQGESDIGMFGWTGDNGDPDNFLNTLLGCDAVGGSNYAQWCNKEFDDLVQKAKQTSNVKERTKLYEQAQVVFKREAPWATIAHSVVYTPMSKNVNGFLMSPFGLFSFYGVSVK